MVYNITDDDKTESNRHMSHTFTLADTKESWISCFLGSIKFQQATDGLLDERTKTHISAEIGKLLMYPTLFSAEDFR